MTDALALVVLALELLSSACASGGRLQLDRMSNAAANSKNSQAMIPLLLP
jgi:hypothetical protein